MPSRSSTKAAVGTGSQKHRTKTAACKTEILVRVWTRHSNGKELSGEEAGTNQPGALAFIQDVIASRNSVLVSADNDLYFSSFRSPAEALVVSRQIQLGMQSFQSKPVSVSISIDAERRAKSSDNESDEKTSETTAAPAGPNHDLVTLVRMSRPAQVLLTHDLLQQVNSLKGLPLKPFQGRFGVYEYLWTSEQKLLGLQSQLNRLTELVEETGGDSNPPHLSGLADDLSAATGTATVTETSARPSLGWRQLLARPWGIAAILVTLLAVVIVGGLNYRSRRPTPEVHTVPSGDVLSTPAKTTPVSPVPEKPQSPPDHPTTTNTGVKDSGVAKETPKQKLTNRRAHEATNASKPVSNAAESKRPCKVSANEYAFRVSLGDQFRAQGKDDDAKRLYTQVLDCDPGNFEARDGLRRIEAAHNGDRP